jgi:hypothetical protein
VAYVHFMIRFYTGEKKIQSHAFVFEVTQECLFNPCYVAHDVSRYAIRHIVLVLRVGIYVIFEITERDVFLHFSAIKNFSLL